MERMQEAIQGIRDGLAALKTIVDGLTPQVTAANASVQMFSGKFKDIDAKQTHAGGWLQTLETNQHAQSAAIQAAISRIDALENSRPAGAPRKADGLLDRRELRDVKIYDGDIKKYHNWKAQIELLLQRHDDVYPDLLEWIETSDEADLDEDHLEAWVNRRNDDQGEIEKALDDVYHLLALKVDGLPLTQVLNCKPSGTMRGAVAWKRLTSAAGGMTDSRKQGLIQLINNPARVRGYQDVIPALEELEKHFAELDRHSDAKLSEQAKIASLRRLMPAELASNCMSQAISLNTYAKLRNYVELQASLRREVTVEGSYAKPATSTSNAQQKPVPMEMHVGVTQDWQHPGHQWSDQTEDSEGDQAMGMTAELNYNGHGGKGKGKSGHFEGTCNYCREYGHRKSECRWLTQRMDAIRAAEAKGKGKAGKAGAQKGFKGAEKGYSQKGHWKGTDKGYGKGWEFAPR